MSSSTIDSSKTTAAATPSSEPTIRVSAAVRRLAESLLRESMESDPSLCATPLTFRHFLASLVFNRSGAPTAAPTLQQQQQQQAQKSDDASSSSKLGAAHVGASSVVSSAATSAVGADHTSASNTSSAGASAAAAAVASKQHSNNEGSSSIGAHGRGALTDDQDGFSTRCEEARVEAVSRARQIINGVIKQRNNKMGANEEASISKHQGASQKLSQNELSLSEWKDLCRNHPWLLRSPMERDMVSSESTGTALSVFGDYPISILPARATQKLVVSKDTTSKSKSVSSNIKSDDENLQDSNKRSSPSSSSSSEKTSIDSGDDSEEDSTSGGDKAAGQEESKNAVKYTWVNVRDTTWNKVSDWMQKANEWLERFISGGIAGGVAKSVIAPGDRVKIIFQVNRRMIFSIAAAIGVASQIIKNNGPLGLWTGHGATLLRVVPYASISFASFEGYNKLLRPVLLGPHCDDDVVVSNNRDGTTTRRKKDAGDESGYRHVALRFICGSAAGATATTATYPLDLLRARYAAYSLHHSGKPYPSYLTGLIEIHKTGMLYSGLGPTLLGIIPYAGASFTVFETLKAQILARSRKNSEENDNRNDDHDGDDATSSRRAAVVQTELATWQRLSAGAIAGLVAQTLTYPLDIVRRRMQVHPEESKTMRHTLAQIYHEEGIRKGLYKGLSMNWVKGPIAVGVSFTINDYLKGRMQRYHAKAALEDEMTTTTTTTSTSTSSTDQQHDDDHDNNKKKNGSRRRPRTADEEAVARLHVLERIACGAVAGAAAKIWTLPFDRMKLMIALGRIEHDGSPGDSFRTVRSLLLATGNPWQGTAGMLLRVAPFAAVSYVMFDAAQPMARRVVLTKEPSFLSDMVAGSTAAATATVVCHPLDVLRSRAAIAESGAAPPFASYLQGLKNENLRSLYTGLKPALVGVCPLAALSFAVYHEGKRRFDDGTFTRRLLLGAVAGIAGQVVSYPINIVRRKAVIEEEASGVSESVVNSLRQAMRTDTFPSMYKRMPLGWTLGAATFAVSFAVHDSLRDGMVAFRKRQARSLLLDE